MVNAFKTNRFGYFTDRAQFADQQILGFGDPDRLDILHRRLMINPGKNFTEINRADAGQGGQPVIVQTRIVIMGLEIINRGLDEPMFGRYLVSQAFGIGQAGQDVIKTGQALDLVSLLFEDPDMIQIIDDIGQFRHIANANADRVIAVRDGKDIELQHQTLAGFPADPAVG